MAAAASVEASARSPSRCRSLKIAEGARQVFVDEPQRAAHALQPDLDEDAGRILDVVAGRLDHARHLAKLREHAARPLGERRVVEQRLPGEAGRQDVGVVLRTPLPGPDLLELEQPRTDARRRAPAAPGARYRSGGQDRSPPAAGRSRRDPGPGRRSPDGSSPRAGRRGGGRRRTSALVGWTS